MWLFLIRQKKIWIRYFSRSFRRKIFYLNLNGRQSLVLFQDVYCDYQLVANHIYNFMKREYMERFYLAVSRKFEGYENLPASSGAAGAADGREILSSGQAYLYK